MQPMKEVLIRSFLFLLLGLEPGGANTAIGEPESDSEKHKDLSIPRTSRKASPRFPLRAYYRPTLD